MDREDLINSYKYEDMLKNLEERIELFADCLFKEIDRLDERLDKIEGKPTVRELKALGIKPRTRILKAKRSQ